MSKNLEIEYRQVSDIHPDPDQPRREFDASAIKELAENIRAVGLINPIAIKPDGTIIAGERRWRAYRDVLARADKDKFGNIPVIVRADLARADAVVQLKTAQVAENLLRKDLSSAEIGAALTHLKMDEGKSESEIAKMLGKTKAWVDSYLRFYYLLKMGNSTYAEAIQSGRINEPTTLDKFAELPDYLQKALLDNRSRWQIESSSIRMVKAWQDAVEKGAYTEDEVTAFILDPEKMTGNLATTGYKLSTMNSLLRGVSTEAPEETHMAEVLGLVMSVDSVDLDDYRNDAMVTMPSIEKGGEIIHAPITDNPMLREKVMADIRKERDTIGQRRQSASDNAFVNTVFKANKMKMLLDKLGVEVPEDASVPYAIRLRQAFMDWVNEQVGEEVEA